MVNIDPTLKALNDILSGMVSIDVSRRESNQQTSFGGLLDARINISIFGFDDLFENPQRRKIHPRFNKTESLIDVIENKENVRIIAHFPGLKKEDIGFEVEDGAIHLRINENGRSRHASIPCDIRPDRVLLTSTTYNNSILEIIFKKI